MIVLAAGETIQGVAGTAASITYTLYGDQISLPSVDGYQKLAQGQLPNATGVLYTVPSGNAALVKSIHLANTTGTDVTGIQLFTSGSAAGNRITGSFTIVAGGWAVYAQGGWQVFNSLGQLLGLGATGATGQQGGVSNAQWPGDPGDDGVGCFGLPSGLVDRSHLGLDAKNWTFLGTISGTGVTVGPLIWTGQYQQIYGEYIIGGYSGGTPVGRLLCGAASITTTGLTNGNGLMEGGTPNATSINVPGCPLAVSLSAIARFGHFFISGVSGSLKQIRIHGMEGNPAVGTAPTIFEGRSFFSDLGTNLLIQRLQLTVYDTLIATAVSVNTFIATTALWAWGRNND